MGDRNGGRKLGNGEWELSVGGDTKKSLVKLVDAYPAGW